MAVQNQPPIHNTIREPPTWQDFARTAEESQRPDMWRGLVGAWLPTFGPTGRILYDVSGYHNDATFHSGKSSDSWRFVRTGHALEFDGTSNDATDTGSVGDLGFNDTNECTVIAKMSIKNVNRGVLEQTAVGDAAGSGFRIHMAGGGTLKFLTTTGGAQTSVNVVFTVPTEIVIVVGTYGINTERALYVNGFFSNSNTTTLGTFDNTVTGKCRVGANITSFHPGDGFLEYCLLFNRFMSEQEVQKDWLDPLAMFRPNAVQSFGVPPAAVGHDWLAARVISRDIADLVRR